MVCLDERPCFLNGDHIEPIAMQTGRVRKKNYAHNKLGSCALFTAIEPLTGFRLTQFHQRRMKKEYILFCQTLAAEYLDALKIRLVQDNLNTQYISAYYENLPADEARELADRFGVFYKPISVNRLNLIETEFSALTRLCLARRILTIEQLKREVLALVTDRMEKNPKYLGNSPYNLPAPNLILTMQKFIPTTKKTKNLGIYSNNIAQPND